MTTKHTPATPLPWKYGDSSLHIYSANTGQHIASVIRHSPMTYLGQAAQDADFIAHAANAYPEFVAKALAVVEAWKAIDEDTQIPEEINGGQIEALEALLRELGEDA